MNLIKILTADCQSNIAIYDLLGNFYEILQSDNWIKNYIYWELEVFKCLGFDLQFENLVEKKNIGNKLQYVSKSTMNQKVVPNFLIHKNDNIDDINSLLIGLRLVGDYLEKTILKPNNETQPLSRLQFINTLK